jgi:hypothetical protein
MANTTQPEVSGNRFKQIGTLIKFTARVDRRFLLYGLAAGLGPIVVVLVLWLVGILSLLWLIVGFMLGLLGFMIVLSNRSQKAMISNIEGQPGAAASVIETMPARQGWTVTPAIATTTQMDVVSLVVGRPGVVLIGEGHPSRVKGLIGQEKRRLAKVVGSAPMSEIIIGHGEGEVPLGKLRMTLMKMPRAVNGGDINALSVRLKALTSRQQMPKGAIPKNLRPQGFRQPRGR